MITAADDWFMKENKLVKVTACANVNGVLSMLQMTGKDDLQKLGLWTDYCYEDLLPKDIVFDSVQVFWDSTTVIAIQIQDSTGVIRQYGNLQTATNAQKVVLSPLWQPIGLYGHQNDKSGIFSLGWFIENRECIKQRHDAEKAKDSFTGVTKKGLTRNQKILIGCLAGGIPFILIVAIIIFCCVKGKNQ